MSASGKLPLYKFVSDAKISYFPGCRKVLFTAVHNFVHLNLAVSLLVGYLVFALGVELAASNKVPKSYQIIYTVHNVTNTLDWLQVCDGHDPVLLPGCLLMDDV